MLGSMVGGWHGCRNYTYLMATTSFPPLSNRPLTKRGRTEDTLNIFMKRQEVFPRFHVIHCEKDKNARTISPFVVSKCLTEILDRGYKATRMASGDLLLEVVNKAQYEKLSNLVSFGNTPVSVTPHRSLNSSRGVVSDQDLLDLTESELLEGWSEQQVIRVQRIKIRRDDKEIPTKHLILTFGTSTLPEYIETGYLKLKVRPYIPNPRRCFKCQRFGHGSLSCRGRQTCAKCSSHEHPSDNCVETPHCANCEGGHAAYSRTCPIWKKEKEIVTLKVTENISFREARRRLCTVQGGPSFADVARKGAVPYRFAAVARTTFSGWAAAPLAPSAEAAGAAPPPKGMQTSGSAAPGPSAQAESPKTSPPVRVNRERATSTSSEAIDTTASPTASQAPKERRKSLERAKKSRTPITGPDKGSPT